MEVTEPEKVKNTDSRIFMNRVSKERISFDRKTPGKDGFSGKDHWHRFNPLPIEGKNKIEANKYEGKLEHRICYQFEKEK